VPAVSFTTEEKTLITFSIAINRTVKQGKGKKGTRSTAGSAAPTGNGLATQLMIRKGDRVRILGHFRERVYEKDGEQHTAKDFIVQDLTFEKRRNRNRAAEAGEPAEATEAAQEANAA
jgi:single-stranded DNA-binding protein